LGWMHLKADFRICLIVLLLDCTNRDARTDSTFVRAQARPDSLHVAVTPRVQNHAGLGGPTLSVDSAISQPTLDTLGGVYTVHLPSEMARLLYDSLPGFTLFPQSNYPAALVAAHTTPLSIVLGDFNGDSAQDVAMLGESDSTAAFIIVLARSATVREAQLVSIQRPLRHTVSDLPTYYLEHVSPQTFISPDNPKYKLELRTDAIHANSENVSTIYYLKNGQVHTFPMAGD
jgi:hypothetical protein